MDDIDTRVRQVTPKAVWKRLMLIVALWACFPLTAVLFVHTVGAGDGLVVYALLIAAWWTISYSGLSWKNSRRVQELLNEGESPVVVFPARRPRTALPWRTVRGCFVVLTERQVLVLAHNRVLDIPTGVLWVADRGKSSAELRADGRLLTVKSHGSKIGLGVTPRRRTATAQFVTALGTSRRPDEPPLPPPPPL
ncbi:hypothetical protein AB0B50_42230 [Streptomyces sp. NPDC041068]|uniref:hypothetical protein n=1 Tax=Streptomyces sp. NPDC041068 TaxID=3155130 RepID=UPI0034096FED